MATLPSPPDGLTPEQLFLGHLKLIEAVIAHTCRQSHFKPQDQEDFEGYVKEKLIEGNYARLRQFKGESKPETFLTVTIKRLLFDYRDHLWGKWRNSAEAERLGEVAKQLETLLVRDELTFSEAVHILRGKGVDLPESELWNLRASLPPRIQRRFVGEEVLQAEASRDLPPDKQLEFLEKAARRRKVFAALYEALAELPPEDRLLMKMWLEMKVADIAKRLQVEQKPLYRRIDKIKAKLREELERRGIGPEDLDDIFGP
ncbi:MAG TPA: sigma-70 family RNA polymerase sigma factor [Thermoanaerobaculia bacterium]|jgi:RNA polymerase sigma factor for flagellar operon FliA|nr:sigma-70 family RNA polymerase sigma factor [Thermoanaerobaculia bacterium]